MANSTLTTKQDRFCEEYLKDSNAAQAAIRAGYSVNSAAAIGCQNLIKVNIKAEIETKRAELSKRIGVTIAGQQAEHARLARKAEEKGDLTTATRNIELIGKTIAAYADKNINIGEKTVIIINPPKVKPVENSIIEET